MRIQGIPRISFRLWKQPTVNGFNWAAAARSSPASVTLDPLFRVTLDPRRRVTLDP
jgi:hypothetical protein